MPVVNLRTSFAASQWKVEFADSVINLCPEINPDAADEAADAEVVRCKDVDPVVAATRWARRHGFDDTESGALESEPDPVRKTSAP